MSSGTVSPDAFYSGTTVYWKKFGRWATGTLFLSFILGGVNVLTAAAAAVRSLMSWVAGQVNGVIASAVAVPVNMSIAAWNAPMPFLRALGSLAGPTVIAIAVGVGIILWTGVLE